MRFSRILIENWQQFWNVDIQIHDRLTIITGANGSGKTTLLNLLARHSGWEFQSLASPRKTKLSQFWSWATHNFGQGNNDRKTIGSIEYSNDKKANLTIPGESSSPQYKVEIESQHQVDCFFIPSHRSVFRYQALNNIPTHSTIRKADAFNRVSESTRNRYLGGRDQPTSYFMKETLISWNIFGRGNADMAPDESLLDNYKGFEAVLRTVLPEELGFKKFSVRNFEIILECDTGDFVIDAASGGISAIIDMAWQIFMFSTDKNKEFTVLIDEIENHLHPTMQRRILPDFVKAFPKASFIVSTHNPLIVSSVRESYVYVFKYTTQNAPDSLRKIFTQKLDLIDKAKTAAEILDEVLGVSLTMPVWAEEQLKKIVHKYAKADVEKIETFNEMRKELAMLGLEKLMPEAITGLTREDNDKN